MRNYREYRVPKVTSSKIEIHREFSSWSEFVDSANDETKLEWETARESHVKDSGSNPWHGTSTWDEAIKMATVTGWKEGRTMLYDALISVQPKPTPYQSLGFSVAGAFPIVPLYCAGSPECMAIEPAADLRHSRPVVRIDYNNWISAMVSPKDMILRGAAVLSFADTLEQKGFSTEIRIIGNTQSGSHKWRYSVVFKKAGEYLDIDRAAFAIAHPATMRRLAFAILEQSQEFEPSMNSSYGMPCHEKNDNDPDTIFIPGSRGNETVESAKKAVAEAAEELLNNIAIAEETGEDD